MWETVFVVRYMIKKGVQMWDVNLIKVGSVSLWCRIFCKYETKLHTNDFAYLDSSLSYSDV